MRGKAGLFFGTAQTTAGLTVPDGWDGNGSLRLPLATNQNFHAVSTTVLRQGIVFADFNFSYITYISGFGIFKNNTRVWGINGGDGVGTESTSLVAPFEPGDELGIKTEFFNPEQSLQLQLDTLSLYVTMHSFSMWIE